jgi:hypothetical protein
MVKVQNKLINANNCCFILRIMTACNIAVFCGHVLFAPLLCFLHNQRFSFQLFVIQCFDGFFGFFIIYHFQKCKAFAFPCDTVIHNFGIGNFTEFGKKKFKLGLVDGRFDVFNK